MGPDEIVSAAEETAEPTGSEIEPTEPAQPDEGSTPTYGWTRRAFFQAAALGAAAAAFLDGKRFAPSIAWANDLSTLSCTANDVNIGIGTVLNEPCACSGGGTFDANVQFSVINGASATRYCVALHIPAGFGVPAQDVILRNSSGISAAAGKATTAMFGTITGFPCNSGGTLVCLGTTAVTSGKCAAGQCVTIAWDTSNGFASCTTADQGPPGGQCRHLQVCIQGFGASLLCSGTDCTSGSSSCSVGCGASATLRACASGGTGTYNYLLHADDGSQDQHNNNSTATSVTFTVTPKQNTNYTLTVTDVSTGCQRTATAKLTTTSIAQPTLAAGTPDCNGNTKFTAQSGFASYVFTIDGTAQPSQSSNTLTVQLSQGAPHTATVTVTDSNGCSNTSAQAPVNVPAALAVSGAKSAGPDCSGSVTLTAKASGGAGGFSFQWFDSASPTPTVPIGTSNPLTTTLAAGDHTITVQATDSAKCVATSAGLPVIHINNPVSVSAAAGPVDCAGNVTLTATPSGGAGGFTYQWFDGTTSIGAGNPLTVPLPQDGKDHSITVKATDSAGCSNTSTAITVHVNLPVSASAAAGTPDCSGNVTLTATPSGGTGKFNSFQWSDGGSAIGTGNPLTVPLPQDGKDHSITVTATDSAGCSGTSTAITVHVNLPVSASAGAGKPDCSGKVTLTATPSGGTGKFSSFQWSDGGSPIGSGNPLTVPLPQDGKDHSITVTATDSAGCSGTSTAITVHVNLPVSASASAGTPDCSGGVTLTAMGSGGAGGFTFQWFDSATPLGTGSSLPVVLAPGDHSITVMATDSAGCAGTSTAVKVHVNQPVSTSLDPGSAPDCTGHLTFTASASGGTGSYTYAWTIDGTAAGGNGPTLAYSPAVDCSPHTVAVKATDSAGCVSGNTASRTVTQVVTTTVK